MAKSGKGGYYAVQKGRQQGIYNTWAGCEAATKGFAGAVYKKFSSQAEAQQFVQGDGYGTPVQSSSSAPVAPKPAYTKGGPAWNKQGSDPGKKKRWAPYEQKSPFIRGNGKSNNASSMPGSSNRPHVDIFPAAAAASSGPKCVVYCDGSSISNGKVGARAGWGVYFEDPALHHLNESRRLPGELQTNNRAELMALIRAIQLAPHDGRELLIFSDSQYSMDAVTKWLPGWKRNNWLTTLGTPVFNQDLIKQLDKELCSRLPRPKLEFVKAHAGIEGNEIVDRMAKHGASLPQSDSEDLSMRSTAPESHLLHQEFRELPEKDQAQSKEDETPWLLARCKKHDKFAKDRASKQY